MKKSPLTCTDYKSFREFIFRNLQEIMVSNSNAYKFSGLKQTVMENSRVIYESDNPVNNLSICTNRYLKLKEGGWGYLVVGYTYRQYNIEKIIDTIYSMPNVDKKLLDSVKEFPYLKIQYDNSKRTTKYNAFFNFMNEISNDVTHY